MLMRGENLIALPFDERAKRVTGEARVVASDVLYNRANGHGAFSSGADGTLVYAAGQAFAFLPSALTWYDREGNVSPTGLTESASPDARRAATVLPGESGDGREVVYLDPARRVMAVTVDEQQERLTLGAPREPFTLESLATSQHGRIPGVARATAPNLT